MLTSFKNSIFCHYKKPPSWISRWPLLDIILFACVDATEYYTKSFGFGIKFLSHFTAEIYKKKPNFMAAILKSKMAAVRVIEKNGTNTFRNP